MKIKIESIRDLKFTPHEENFIHALEEDRFFEDYVLKTRKIFCNQQDANPKLIENRMQWIFIAAHILVKTYKNLPDCWVNTFGYIINSGVALPSPTKITFRPIYYESIEKLNEKGFGPAKRIIRITIEDKMSIKQICKFLNEEAGFKKALGELSEEPRINADIGLYKNILNVSKKYKGEKFAQEVNKFWKIEDYNAAYKYKKRGEKYLSKLLQKDQGCLKKALYNLYSVALMAKKENYTFPQYL
jgi:hypothetical protein